MFLIYREVFDNYTKFQGRLQRAYCQELCLWSFRWIFGVEASGLSKSCPKKLSLSIIITVTQMTYYSLRSFYVLQRFGGKQKY